MIILHFIYIIHLVTRGVMHTRTLQHISQTALIQYLRRPHRLSTLHSLVRQSSRDAHLVRPSDTTERISTATALQTLGHQAFRETSEHFAIPPDTVQSPPALFAHDAIDFVAKYKKQRVQPYRLLMTTLSASLAYCIAPSATAVIAGALFGSGLIHLVTKGSLALEGALYQSMRARGVPASYDTRHEIIVFYGAPSACQAHLFLLHEITHVMQRLCVPSIPQNTCRAFWEGHAIGFEYYRAKQLEHTNAEYRYLRVNNELMLLGAALLLVDPSAAAPLDSMLQHRSWMPRIQHMRDTMAAHAVGYAAFRLAESEVGTALYRNILHGDLRPFHAT